MDYLNTAELLVKPTNYFNNMYNKSKITQWIYNDFYIILLYCYNNVCLNKNIQTIKDCVAYIIFFII